MFDKIKGIGHTFTYITTGNVIGAYIFIKIFYSDTTITIDLLWQILAVALICSFGNFISSCPSSSNKGLLIRFFLHYLYVNVVVIGCATWFEWIYLDHLDMILGMIIIILLIYTVIWFAVYEQHKRLAAKLNKQLKEFYQKDDL